MVTMSLTEARVIVAKQMIARAVRKFMERGWEDFPELGEYDWDEVVLVSDHLSDFPSYDDYTEAYRLLSERARND